MNNRRVDLNLLHIFRALMEERNVSRAAGRLSMTQPAVSNALNRLRDLLKDELFTRVVGGMKPTQRALNLWPSVKEALDVLNSSVLQIEFDPATTTSTFRFAVTDSLTPSMVPRLSVMFAATAPNAQLQFHHHSNLTSTNGLMAGELDCAVGMFPRLPSGLQAHALLTDDYVCVMRCGHPLANHPLSIDEFAHAVHVLMKPSGTGTGAVDNWLGFHQRARRIAVVVNHFHEALEIVSRTDLLSCMPRKYVEETLPDQAIAVRDIPFETEKILYKLAWHERTAHAPEQMWFRSLISNLLADQSEQSTDLSKRR